MPKTTLNGVLEGFEGGLFEGGFQAGLRGESGTALVRFGAVEGPQEGPHNEAGAEGAGGRGEEECPIS